MIPGHMSSPTKNNTTAKEGTEPLLQVIKPDYIAYPKQVTLPITCDLLLITHHVLVCFQCFKSASGYFPRRTN